MGDPLYVSYFIAYVCYGKDYTVETFKILFEEWNVFRTWEMTCNTDPKLTIPIMSLTLNIIVKWPTENIGTLCLRERNLTS